MKIINEGSVRIGKWWIGVTLECKRCGRKVELEQGDDASPYWLPVEPDRVMVVCECCGSRMEKGQYQL